MSIPMGSDLRVVFRLDGGAAVGMGHLMRCHALASAFNEEGWTVGFAVNAEAGDDVLSVVGKPAKIVSTGLNGSDEIAAHWQDGIDLLVIDHYGLGASFEQACRPWAKRIAVIDDMTDRPHDCDALLNTGPGVQTSDYAALLPKGCRVLLGPKFALLRPQFSHAAKKESLDSHLAGRVLITMGGSDPENITSRVLDAFLLGSKTPEVRVILGPSYAFGDTVKNRIVGLTNSVQVFENVDHMAEHMAWCDIAVSAAGSTTWELCFMGVPTVYIQTADNQDNVVAGIEMHEIGKVVGKSAYSTDEDIIECITALQSDEERRHQYSENGRALVDGHGAARVVKEFIRLME